MIEDHVRAVLPGIVFEGQDAWQEFLGFFGESPVQAFGIFEYVFPSGQY